MLKIEFSSFKNSLSIFGKSIDIHPNGMVDKLNRKFEKQTLKNVSKKDKTPF